MTRCSTDGSLPSEPLRFGLVIFTPIAEMPGVPSFFYWQPLLTSRITNAAGIVIAAEFVLLIAKWFLQGRRISILNVNQEGAMLSQSTRSFLAAHIRKMPLVIGFGVSGGFTAEYVSPAAFLLVPLFTVSGVRGAIPMLILQLLSVIMTQVVLENPGGAD